MTRRRTINVLFSVTLQGGSAAGHQENYRPSVHSVNSLPHDHPDNAFFGGNRRDLRSKKALSWGAHGLYRYICNPWTISYTEIVAPRVM